MADKTNKIAALDTEYAKQKYAEFQHQQRQLVFKRRRLAAILIAATCIFAFIGVQLFSDFQRLYTLENLKAETKEEAAAVVVTADKLQQDVALLKDEDYVAKLARSRFFYSKDGELIYTVPDTSQSDDAEKSTSSTNAE